MTERIPFLLEVFVAVLLGAAIAILLVIAVVVWALRWWL